MMKFALLASVAPLAFMSDAVPVVVIVTENGPVRINASDYDPAKHTLHEGEEAPAVALRDDGPTIAEYVSAGYPATAYPPQGYASKSSAEEIAAAVAKEAAASQTALAASTATAAAAGVATPAAPQLMVMKDGKGKDARYFVVDPAGNKVERDGIDASGYAAEQDAWNAILAQPR